MAEDVFFTADTHFGHERLLTLGAGRPFSSAEEMTEKRAQARPFRAGSASTDHEQPAQGC